MKKLFYLAVFISFFSCQEKLTSGEASTSDDQTPTETKSSGHPSEELGDIKSVDDIKKEYAYIIDRLESGSMDSTSFEYNCHEEKKGKVIYFSEKGQLRMIKHTYNQYSHYSGTDEYFVKNDSLFFVYYNHEVWNFTGQNQTKDDITEIRFYIIDNKPVKCLEKKLTMLSRGKDTLQSTIGTNKELECSSLESISEDFELFLKLRDQQENLICLED